MTPGLYLTFDPSSETLSTRETDADSEEILKKLKRIKHKLNARRD